VKHLSPTVIAAYDQRHTARGGSGRPKAVTLPPIIQARIVTEVAAMQAECRKLSNRTITQTNPKPAARPPLIVASRGQEMPWPIFLGACVGFILAMWLVVPPMIGGR